MQRCVKPELLDDLPARDPQAIRSRGDLRRVNRLMGHASILRRALALAEIQKPLRHVIELGAGDGTFLLGLAGQLARPEHQPEVQLVDQQDLLTPETRRAFSTFGWNVQAIQADVFEWLARPAIARSDLWVANLFLHHFSEEQLQWIFRQAAERTNVFVACEPRRSAFALTAARWLGVIGCNAVTRHDAVISVRAGFTGPELSALWPDREGWRLVEQPAGLFSHCFMAKRL